VDLLANIQAVLGYENGMELIRYDSVTGYGRIIFKHTGWD
jgi:hypothetical protein